MSKKNKQRIRLIIVNLFFILVCFGVLIPILYAFSVSLNAENSLLGANFSFLPKRMTLQNYKAVFTGEADPALVQKQHDTGGDNTGDLTGNGNSGGICLFQKAVSGKKADFKDSDPFICISVTAFHDGAV